MNISFILCQHEQIDSLGIDDEETTAIAGVYETLGGALKDCPIAIGRLPKPNTNKPFTGGLVWRNADWSIRWERVRI